MKKIISSLTVLSLFCITYIAISCKHEVPVNADAGSANTGGGGGGGRGYGGTSSSRAGGSGVVILRYSDTLTISNPGGGLTISTPSASGGFKVSTITAGAGNIQLN